MENILKSIIQAADFKELKQTLFRISVREAQRNPKEWEALETEEDVVNIYEILDHLHEMKKAAD